MKKILFAFMIFSIFSAFAFADTTLEGMDDFVSISGAKAGGEAITDYDPQLEISITHDFSVGGHSMGIACDGSYYYMVNGGSSSYGIILTHDLDGNFVNSAATGLDGRAVFYNPNDGDIYVKVYGMDLYTVNPVTGATILIYYGIFHDYQSRVAFDPATQLMYEMVEGTVHVIELATGNTVSTMTGFGYGSWGYNWAIATNGAHLFTWTDGGTVYAYDLDGNYEESFTISNGSYGWSLDFANDMLCAADDANGGPGGVWYGYSGVEAGLSLVISIIHDFSVGGHSMGIACDGNYYYMVNGGSPSYGVILTHNLDGSFVRSVAIGLSSRSVFYNRFDGNIYVKAYGEDLYIVDPVMGTTTPVYTGIFHNGQSHVAFNPFTQLMYEMVEGTVYVIEMATGNTIDVMTGFNYGSWGYNWAIATNGLQLFTWTDGGTVYAYDLDGNFEETLFIPSGSYGYSLDYCNDLLWAADDANSGPNGVWYGYSGVEGPTDVTEEVLKPSEFILSQNYPNPFNASTTIRYSLFETGPVNISIYNLLGQEVAILYEGMQDAGQHIVTWDARDLPSGVYFARMKTENGSESIKMALLK
jgi:hypothetical protein